MNSNSLSYHARRLNMRVDAVVEDGTLNWHYVAGGDEWKQSVPLSKMFPHPMFSIDHGSRWKYLAATVLLPALAFGLVRWFESGLIYEIMIPTLLFLILAFWFSAWLVGPIEWATFDTTLKDKTVYVFRGVGDSSFDEFVAALDEAIVAASQNTNDSRESRDGGDSG